MLLKRSLHYSCCSAKNYYKILGLTKNAKGSDVRKAYRKLIQKYATGGYSAKFQELSEAFRVLGEQKWRTEYDRFDAESQPRDSRKWEPSSHRIFPGGSAFRATRGPFSETSNPYLGHWGCSRAREAQELKVDISFEEAARGVEKEVRVKVVDQCQRCRGSGCDPRHKKIFCPQCEGSGMVLLFSRRCDYCAGHGYLMEPCSKCEGEGSVREKKKFKLDIPAGIENGHVLRTWIERTSIYAVVKVAPSTRHRREKEHIFTDVEVSLAQAALGGTIEVPGIFDTILVHVPPGTSSHQQMCLKGKGIKRMERPGHGDQILNIKIAVPKDLSERQRELMTEFAKL